MQRIFPDMDSKHNLLPRDGVVHYFGRIFSKTEADRYFEMLLRTIAWSHDEIFLFGKKIVTKRKVAWYGDRAFEYTYSKTTKKAQAWPSGLLEIKMAATHSSGESFNSCLLNLYHSGAEGMGWHSDDEKELKQNGAIASVSFGAARRFTLKHKKTKEKLSINLEHGSLWLMKGPTQAHWLHRLPTSKKVHGPRINLTFRTFIGD